MEHIRYLVCGISQAYQAYKEKGFQLNNSKLIWYEEDGFGYHNLSLTERAIRHFKREPFYTYQIIYTHGSERSPIYKSGRLRDLELSLKAEYDAIN